MLNIFSSHDTRAIKSLAMKLCACAVCWQLGHKIPSLFQSQTKIIQHFHFATCITVKTILLKSVFFMIHHAKESKFWRERKRKAQRDMYEVLQIVNICTANMRTSCFFRWTHTHTQCRKLKQFAVLCSSSTPSCIHKCNNNARIVFISQSICSMLLCLNLMRVCVRVYVSFVNFVARQKFFNIIAIRMGDRSSQRRRERERCKQSERDSN